MILFFFEAEYDAKGVALHGFHLLRGFGTEMPDSNNNRSLLGWSCGVALSINCIWISWLMWRTRGMTLCINCQQGIYLFELLLKNNNNSHHALMKYIHRLIDHVAVVVMLYSFHLNFQLSGNLKWIWNLSMPFQAGGIKFLITSA